MTNLLAENVDELVDSWFILAMDVNLQQKCGDVGGIYSMGGWSWFGVMFDTLNEEVECAAIFQTGLRVD